MRPTPDGFADVARTWREHERWHRRTLFAIAGALALVYAVGVVVTIGPGESLAKGDARSYFAYLPSIVLDRDLDLRNQFSVLQPEGDSDRPFGETPDGRASNPFPIAPALTWLPGFLAGLGMDAVIGGSRETARPRGYGFGAMLGTALWSILLVGIGAELTRRLAAACTGVAPAFPATLMAWLGTAALYYTVISPLYSHAPGWVAVSLMLWLAWRASARGADRGAWLLSGLAAGWVVAVRLQDAPFVVVPAALLLYTLRRPDPTRTAIVVTATWLAAVGAGYSVQAVTWYALEGTFVPYGGMGGVAAPTVSNLWGTLFSTGYRGWISWTPIVLPGLLGLVVLATRRGDSAVRWLAVSGLAGIAGVVLLDVIHPFGAGAAYGGRRYVSATPLLALGLATLLGSRTDNRLRQLAQLALPALTAWNLCLLLAYELLVIRHGVYPSLVQAARFAVGLGAP